jgi:hypothetical protein
VRKATNHSGVKEPRRADQIPLETSANGDSDIGEFEDEKDLATRQVKRTISLDEEEATRPARRPVSTLPVPYWLPARNLTGKEKFKMRGNGEDRRQGWYFLSSPVIIPRVGVRPQVHQRRRQTSDKIGSRQGWTALLLYMVQRICLWMVQCVDFLSMVIVYQ